MFNAIVDFHPLSILYPSFHILLLPQFICNIFTFKTKLFPTIFMLFFLLMPSFVLSHRSTRTVTNSSFAKLFLVVPYFEVYPLADC